MEPMNNSLKNIIQFVLCIQDSCDEYRKCMEHLFQREYTSYLNEWKSSRSKAKLSNVKKKETKSASEPKCLQIDSEDQIKADADLELTLADSLLEKARSIRTKNMKVVNGLVDCRNISAFSSVTPSVSCDLKQLPEKVQTRKKLPFSKSDIMINSHKSYIVPRSKSVNVPLRSKCTPEACDSKSCLALSSKTCVVKCTNGTSNKTSKDFAVISNIDLNRLKNLQLNLPSCHNSEERIVIQPSDASKSRNKYQSANHPSSAEFLSLMKDRINNTSSEVKLKMWYPFLSSKSKAFLTTFSCDSYSSIKELYSILYSIQETMMWIDLLHLLETEICPNIIVDMTDINSLRIYNYLHSISHPNLKRTPIIFPIK